MSSQKKDGSKKFGCEANSINRDDGEVFYLSPKFVPNVLDNPFHQKFTQKCQTKPVISIGGSLMGLDTFMKEKQQLAIALVVLFVVGYLIIGGRHARGDDHFRDQFRLPASAEIAEMHMPPKGRPDRAVYRIPEADWDAFVASLNATATPFLFGFSGDPAQHAQIARWKDPPTMKAADAPKHLLDIPRVYDFYWDYRVKNGKMLCVVYVAGSAAGARACGESTKNDPLYAAVVGVVDFDQRLVHTRFTENSGGFRLF